MSREQRAKELMDLICPWVPSYASKVEEQNRKLKLAVIMAALETEARLEREGEQHGVVKGSAGGEQA